MLRYLLFYPCVKICFLLLNALNETDPFSSGQCRARITPWAPDKLGIRPDQWLYARLQSVPVTP